MSAITTHILDTSTGKPAANVAVTLDFLEGETWTTVGSGRTNSDGRVPNLMNEDVKFQAGQYRIEFAISEYFESSNTEAFYPYVKIVFIVRDEDSHYHVPLLLNPFGYSTYRGS